MAGKLRKVDVAHDFNDADDAVRGSQDVGEEIYSTTVPGPSLQKRDACIAHSDELR